MKFKTTKVLAFLLAMVMVLSLAACGQKPAESSSESKPAESSSQPASSDAAASSSSVVEEKKEPVEIVVRMYDTGDALPQDRRDEVLAAINEYIEPLINVKIKKMYWTNDGSNLDLMLGAGEEIDLWWNNGNAATLGLQGAAYDLTEKIKEYPDLYNLIPEAIWESSKIRGNNYYIPVYKESAVGYGLLIPNDWKDKFGWDLSAAKSIEDIEPWLEDLKQEGVDIPFMKHTFYFKNFLWDDFAWINDYLVVDRDGDTTKIAKAWETQEMYDLISLFYDWNQKGYISQEEMSQIASATIKEYRLARETGIHTWTTVPDNEANNDGRNTYPDVNLSYDVWTMTDAYVDTGSAIGSTYQLNAKSTEEEIDACLKFVQLLFTDPDKVVGDLLCWGIEGKDYNLVNNQVEKTDLKQWVQVGVWSITAVDGAHWVKGTATNLPELYDEFNNTSSTSVTAGFYFDTTNVEAEITACNAVISEYKRLISHGFYDPAEYMPIINQKLKEAGIDKVQAECQKQYDEWLKTK